MNKQIYYETTWVSKRTGNIFRNIYLSNEELLKAIKVGGWCLTSRLELIKVRCLNY